MNRLHCLALVCGLLFPGSLPLSQPSIAAADETRPPQEPSSQADLAAEFQRIRKQLEDLTGRINRLERMDGGDVAGRRALAVGEKERLEAEARKIVARHHAEKSAIWKRAHAEIRGLRVELIRMLAEFQDRYTRQARLDDALAIRCAISSLREPSPRILTDPGILRRPEAMGKVLFFRVTGSSSGSLYGTDIYTSDSSLATAAVHAGVVKLNENGIVKVTTIPSHQGFVASTRNGITSSAWSSYSAFRVEAPGDEDGDFESENRGGAPAPDGEHDSPKEMPRLETPVAPPPLPADAREHLEQFEQATGEIGKHAREKAARLLGGTIDQLLPIQDAHTRAARLDEAVAIRDLIRKLAEGRR